MEFKVEEDGANDRLDKFLTVHLPEKSRSQIQKMIKSGQILVNHNIVSAHFSLKVGDIIAVAEEPAIINADVKDNSSRKQVVPEIQIIEDNDDFAVINKPAGITVHPTETSEEITLVDILLAKYPNIVRVGEDPIRPGIVHRLDKEVSGLMVIAKNNDSFFHLKEQFQNRTIRKNYLGLVYGRIDKDEDVINFPIERASAGHKMSALPLTEKGKPNINGRRAVTEFLIIKRFINYTYLKLRIKTGRTHQIRVHLSAYGHPLVGDDVYSTRKTREQNKKNNLGRIFLVASELAFRDQSGQMREYKIDLPEELENLLAAVK